MSSNMVLNMGWVDLAFYSGMALVCDNSTFCNARENGAIAIYFILMMYNPCLNTGN